MGRPQRVTLACNRVLDPIVWQRILSDASLLPFLWDIDKSVIMSHGPGFDYELLVRQLSQPEMFDKGHSLHTLPSRLRNRRRIWRLLEDMRAGDRAYDLQPDQPLSIYREDPENESYYDEGSEEDE